MNINQSVVVVEKKKRGKKSAATTAPISHVVIETPIFIETESTNASNQTELYNWSKNKEITK